MKLHATLVLALISLGILAGCGDGTDPRILGLRSQFLVEQPPVTERPVPDIRKGLKSGELKAATPFVVRVRINAGDAPPFANGKASFVVTDATGHDGDESHDPHECPFCRRDIKSVIALVEFSDDEGQTLSVDSRELFNVKEFDLLVIEGTGHFNDDDMLVIAARKMFPVR